MSIVFGFNLGIVFSVAMVVLAGGYILYQTSKVLAHYHTESHTRAVLVDRADVLVPDPDLHARPRRRRRCSHTASRSPRCHARHLRPADADAVAGARRDVDRVRLKPRDRILGGDGRLR